MNDVWRLLLGFAGGMVLGGIYFGGLWWTLLRLPTSRTPASLLVASYVVRLGLVGIGFLLFTGWVWDQAFVCLAGLVVARWFVVRWARPAPRTDGGERWN